MNTTIRGRAFNGRFLAALAAISMAAPAVRADYESTVLSDNPVAYYPLYLTNSIAVDLSGNGNDGAYINLYPGYNNVPGPSPYITNGVSFDGLSTYVDLSAGANTALLNFGGPITMEAWVQSATGGYIMGKGYDQNQNANEVEMRVGGGILHGGTYNSTDGDRGVSGGTVNSPDWSHAVITFDGSNWNVYLNGKLLASSPDTVGAINFDDPWAIGDGTVNGADRILTGNLSQVALYSHALTGNQILAHYLVGMFGSTNVRPIITQQPQSQVASPGATITLEFAAQSLTPITNQWYKGNSPLNETNATLVLTNVQTGDAGSYSVVIGNSSGTTNSAAAIVSIEAEGPYGFSPIPIDAGSFNADIIIEKEALVPATTATLDSGTANNNFTWFEQGYYTGDPSLGLPPAGTTLINASLSDHSYDMAPSYTNNDAVLLNSSIPAATLTVTTPAAFSGLSFLVSAGGGDVTINYTVHHADSSTDTGSFIAPDWFGSGTLALGVGGRVDAATRGVQTWSAGSTPYLFSADVSLGNTASPVTSVDFAYASGGNACVLAVSGSTGSDYTPIAVTGYNQDLIIEASAQHFNSGAYTTVSVDNGAANTQFSWYEAGYSTTPSWAAGTGVPVAGSAFTSQAEPDHLFKMASSYTANDVAYVDISTGSTITFANPVNVWALSFLTAAGHGPINVNYTVHHADSSTESGTFASPDWFGGGSIARAVNGRVDVGNGGFQTWGSGGPRMLSADIGITNISSPVTSIDLSFGAGNYSGGNAAVFAVSGAYINQDDAFTSIVPNSDKTSTMHFAGIPGYRYVIQFTTSLTPPVTWENVRTNTADGAGAWQFTDGNTNHAAGFYRTLYLP